MSSSPSSSLLFFLPSPNGGGAERALLNLLKQICRVPSGRWKPILVTRSDQGALAQEFSTALPGLRRICLGLPRSGAWSSAVTVVKLARILRDVRPDVLISFLSLPAVSLARELSGISCRMVTSIQNPVEMEVVAGSLLAKLRDGLITRALRSCDLCLPLVPGIAQQLEIRYGVQPERTYVLPNSVDLDEIEKELQGIASRESSRDDLTLVTACRLAPQKRVDLLLRGFALVRREVKARLLILGEGAERALLEKLSRELGVAHEVTFLGFDPHPWRRIAAADLFLLTSDYEGFGNVLLEAMACGVPVVSTRAPFGPEFIIEHERNGILVPPGDVEAIAGAILRVCRDSALAKRLREAGRARAREFSSPVIYGRFQECLERLR